MKKKRCLLIFIFLLLFSLPLVGCNNVSENQKTEKEDKEEEEKDKEENKKEDKKEDITQKELYEEEAEVGETIETEAGVFTLKAVNRDIETIDVEAAIVNINHIKATSGNLIGESKKLIGSEEVEYISMNIKVENTSGKDIHYYVGQTQIVTDTGEQIDPNVIMSDHIEGEIRAGVTQTGNLVYIMESSKADEVSEVRIIINGPQNENYNEIGDEIDITVEL